MLLFTDFLLATIATVIVIVCYALLLVKLKPANGSSEFSKLLQETYEDLSIQRRTDLLRARERILRKIKEERIKEYLDRKKRKLEGS